MPPTMTDYTFAFGNTGTVLNTDSLGFPFIDVTSVTGLDTAPLRVATDEHQGSDGTYVDSPFMSMRTIVVTGTLYTDPSDPDTLLNQLRADYASDTARPWYFQLPNQPLRFVNAKGGGLQYNIDASRRTGRTPVQFTVLAGDPYIYDYPMQSSSISVPTISNVGMSFNVSFNLGFGGAIPTNAASVTNYGTHTAYPTIILGGPLTNPVLTDAFGITMAFNLTLAAGDQLVINCKDKSVVLNGMVSRRNTLTGTKWFSVPAGASETVFFGADSGTGSATVNLSSTYY
jgi:Phage tail protein